MRRWRVPLILSAVVLAARLAHLDPLFDVVSGRPAAAVSVAYPLLHLVLAPLTLTADWLNGGGTADLIGFGGWSLVAYLVARLASDPARRSVVREAACGLAFLAAVAAFLAWGTLAPRPIPRLVPGDSALLVFDVHSHTEASHDGRRGFDAAANAAWHRRAGFDAAFVTDHNVFGAAGSWRAGHAGQLPRLLNGEELSLNGLHMVLLGNDSLVPSKPWDRSFDSSLLLLRHLTHEPSGTAHRPFLIASLPEYWRNHWGPDLGRVTEAGARGLEIWTTSPRAMDFPPARRREVIARAASLGLALFGATDMHGLGYAATVWNVTSLPGWQSLGDAALTDTLLARFRAEPGAVRVVALRRRLAETRGRQIVGAPLGVLMVLRTASWGHAVALLAWIWLVAGGFKLSAERS